MDDVGGILCLEEYLMIIVIFSGELLLRLLEHYCKVSLAHWIEKNEHHIKKIKETKINK